LGAVLRIDVKPNGTQPYTVPDDNPFRNDSMARPELFAIGLRNPWRLAFTTQGRLIVADVGQDAREEISVVPAGGNLGWNIREADRCFEPAEGCQTEGLIDPIYAYGREEGISVTGGAVWTAESSALTDHYIFGDFGTGRLWALKVPEQGHAPVLASSLGRFALLPSTFGRTLGGELLVADYGSGSIYRLVPAPPPTAP